MVYSSTCFLGPVFIFKLKVFDSLFQDKIGQNVTPKSLTNFMTDFIMGDGVGVGSGKEVCSCNVL